MSQALTITLTIEYGKTHKERQLTIPENGFLTLIGPNASGKSHILRALKEYFQKEGSALNGGKIRFLSSDRLASMESFRLLHHANQALKVGAQYRTGEPIKEHTNLHFEESLAVDYQRLQQRLDIQLKIRARLKEFFNRDIELSWEAEGLSVNFIKEESAAESYGIGREASGLIHLVGLLSAIYDDEISLLIIDEPELSLHPQYQSFLLEEMTRNSGLPNDDGKKMIIIATHSEELINLNQPEDLKSLGFCRGLEFPVHQLLNFDALTERERLENLISRLSTEFKRAFFADHILLLEGPTDEKIARALDHKRGLSLAGRGVELLPLLGKGDFFAAYRLLFLLQKEVGILADFDWVIDAPEWVDQFLNETLKERREEASPPKREMIDTHRYRLAKSDYRFNFKGRISAILALKFDPERGLFRYFRQHAYYSEQFDPMLSYLTQQNRGAKESFYQIKRLFLQQHRFSEESVKKFLVALKRVIICREVERANEAIKQERGGFIRAKRLIRELEVAEQIGIYLIQEGELESLYFSASGGSKTVRVNEEIIAISRAECDDVASRYHSLLKPLERFVIDDRSAELNLIYDELDRLANDILRFYRTERFDEIRALFYRVKRGGIFSLSLDQLPQFVEIRIASRILTVGEELGVLTIHHNDDAGAVSEAVHQFLFNEERRSDCPS